MGAKGAKQLNVHSKDGLPVLSVVIVTWNTGHLIGQCLDSLLTDCAHFSTEILVVDNASEDDTLRVLASYPAVRTIALRSNTGFAKGNNVALRQCRGEFILLLNPDTIVHPGAIGALLDGLATQTRAGAAGPRLVLASGQTQVECARNLPRVGNLFPWLLLIDKAEWKFRFRSRTNRGPGGTLLDQFNLLAWSRDQRTEVESVCGACILLRRAAFDQVGLFDELLPMYLDDIDYCRRIRNEGWRIVYEPASVLTHLWKQSSSQASRDGDFYAMGCHAIWVYLAKHDGKGKAALFAAMSAVAGAVRVAVASLLLLLSPRSLRRRQALGMAYGLFRWAWRLPHRVPELNQSRTGNATQRRVVGIGEQL